MLESLTEAELAKLQKESPELAVKLIGNLLEGYKRDNMVQRTKPESTSRYSDSTNAPYYNRDAADRALSVLEQFISDKDNDMIVPYKVVGLSRASSKSFYTQAINYIIDNSAEFKPELVDIARHLKHRATDMGLRFTYVFDLAPTTILRVPKEKQVEHEAPTPILPPVVSWRSKVEKFLDEGKDGEAVTIAPVSLSDAEVLDLVTFLSEWGGLLHVVRNEKITIKKLYNPNKSE